MSMKAYCYGTTKDGRPCNAHAYKGGYCRHHQNQAPIVTNTPLAWFENPFIILNIIFLLFTPIAIVLDNDGDLLSCCCISYFFVILMFYAGISNTPMVQ